MQYLGFVRYGSQIGLGSQQQSLPFTYINLTFYLSINEAANSTSSEDEELKWECTDTIKMRRDEAAIVVGWQGSMVPCDSAQ